MGISLNRVAFGAVSVICLIALAVGCDSPLLDLGEEVTLSASVDENRQPLEIRERFSLEDDSIYVQVSIPPETAGPEQRDFHFEFFDGEGQIVGSNGAIVTRTRDDWTVRSRYRINPEIDAPGNWSMDVYIDDRHVERVSFPVTATADAPLPDTPPSPGRSAGCCRGPGSFAYQVFLMTGVDEDKNLLTGRRDSFRFADGKLGIYLRMTNIPNGSHNLRYEYYDASGRRLWSSDYSFEAVGRRWFAWSWVNITPQRDTAGLWTVDIHLDGKLIGSVRVPVDA